MSHGARLAGPVVLAGVLLAGTAPAQVPTWERVLRWLSGDSDRTDVAIMMMGSHMQMSVKRLAAPGDRDRAADIETEARRVVERYPDEPSVLKAGYKPFHETGVMGEEIHFTNLGAAIAEGKHVDYARPGSLLLRRTPEGLVTAGVMYSAPGKAGAAELDARAPLSVATWHRHVDFCLPSGPKLAAQARDVRFGYAGTIHEEAACARAGGFWIPIAFGWMTHVYPGRKDAWGGESMSMSGMSHDEH